MIRVISMLYIFAYYNVIFIYNTINKEIINFISLLFHFKEKRDLEKKDNGEM